MKAKSVVSNESLREKLRERVFGEDDKPLSLSEKMERDQRSADRINAWVNRFSSEPKPR